MCPRKYHGNVENQYLKIADWTYEEFAHIFDQELIDQLDLIYFCGNFGDPIMNDDLIKMCQHITDLKPSIELRIHTNGGARSTKWWKELYNALPKKHMVFFGIDGLEDTNHIYRIGVNYKALMRNAQTFIDAGGIAEWVFIKFKHNQHQEQLAEDLSKSMGFKKFTVKNTTRFIGEEKYSVLDKDGNVEYYLEPPSDNQVVFLDHKMIKNYQSLLEKATVDCYVLRTKEIYIDAHKNVFPCCFLSSAPYHYRPTHAPENETKAIIHTVHNKILDQYYQLVDSLGGIDKVDAMKHRVKDIIDNDVWQNVWNEYWTDKKLITCVRVCGKTQTSKPIDQFVKKVTNVS
jgi:MoaA/NifB/PqqE/SkfB family radical SAM enzyme